MSTTFEVFPKLARIPSYEELLVMATVRLHEYLTHYGISAQPAISIALLANDNNAPQPIDLKAPARWRDSEYAWFHVEKISGGTDAYFVANEEIDYALWQDELRTNDKAAAQKDLVEVCLANGYHWRFRRSVGQPAIINVAYGLIAASLARLTEGFIYTGDSAWDYERFPAIAEDFFTWYFRPEMALEPDNADWAERCIKSLPEELSA